MEYTVTRLKIYVRINVKLHFTIRRSLTLRFSVNYFYKKLQITNFVYIYVERYIQKCVWVFGYIYKYKITYKHTSSHSFDRKFHKEVEVPFTSK